MIERDDHIPPLDELCAELAQARALSRQRSPARQGERCTRSNPRGGP